MRDTNREMCGEKKCYLRVPVSQWKTFPTYLVWMCWRTLEEEIVESSNTGLSMEYEGGGDLLFFLLLLANLRIRLMPLPLLPPLSFVLFCGGEM